MTAVVNEESGGSTTVATPGAGIPRVSSWCHSQGKRLFDVLVVSFSLLLCLPLMAIIAIMVAVTSPGPVLFRQKRVGENGREFELLKFRTMFHNLGNRGPGVTRSGDPRITSVGRLLRKCKLDELPQLLNVLRGDMSLVGPRPDLAEFCQTLAPEYQSVLGLRPGLTGWATLQFRHEEQLLAAVPKEQLVPYYRDTILPQKAQLDLAYANRATFWSDAGILWSTLFRLAQLR